MHLLELPLELLEQLFLDFIQVRIFKRVMRLRLVSRRFQHHTEEAIFRSRILDGLIDAFSLHPISSKAPWVSFIQTYLARRVLLGVDHGCPGGHIRLVAERICELTDETGDRSLLSCTRSLHGLAFFKTGMQTLPLIKSTPENARTEDQFKSDLLDAAVYLNNIPLAKRLLSGEPGLGWRHAGSKRNPGLEGRLEVATYHGNLEMIKLLLAADPTLENNARLPVNLAQYLLRYASRGTEGHRDIFNFVLDMSDPDEFTVAYSGLHNDLETAISITAFPENYRRGAKILGLESEVFSPPRWGRYLLCRLATSADQGQVDMVRYCLERGVYLNTPSAKKGAVLDDRFSYITQDCKPLFLAAENGHIETTKLLLESGADPNWFASDRTALMAAVNRGNLVIARMLVDHGADVNDGCPPPIVLAVRNENMEMFQYLREKGAVLDTPETGPWAMSFAEAFGLDSMIDHLNQEGVERGVILRRVPYWEEIYSSFPKGQ